MRRLAVLIAVVTTAGACADAGRTPTSPDATPISIRTTHTPGSGADLCEGRSPCDAFDYRPSFPAPPADPASDLGHSGFCFLSPFVDNHLSDPACSAPFVPGIPDGELKLTWCQIDAPSDPANPLEVHTLASPRYCLGTPIDLVQDPGGGEFYRGEIQFKRGGRGGGDVGKYFRIYVVRGDEHYAHRDIVVDPNETSPADAPVLAVGTGNTPIKVRITEGFGCDLFSSAGTPDQTLNAAECLIAGDPDPFMLNGGGVTAEFDFPAGNDPFFALFELTECEDLHDITSGGDPSRPAVDVQLLGCKVTIESTETNLRERASLVLDLVHGSSEGRIFVIEQDEDGQSVLPPLVAPGWFLSALDLPGFLGIGLKKLASVFGVKPLVAVHSTTSAGGTFDRLSDFQAGVLPVGHYYDVSAGAIIDATNSSCDNDPAPSPACLDLGTVPDGQAVTAAVHAGALCDSDNHACADPDIDAPGVRYHFLPQNGGSVACPAGTAGVTCFTGVDSYDGDGDGNPDNPYDWGHTVIYTDSDGVSAGLWTPGPGANPKELKVLACGAARPGTTEPTLQGSVYGTLAFCTDRDPTAVGHDSGPEPGSDPYEPNDIVNEVAIRGLSLTYQASSCPAITINGTEGDGEWACADVQGFIAPLKGKKSEVDNAWVFTHNDATHQYIALKVKSTDLDDMFITLDNTGNGDSADDDVLLLRLKGENPPGASFDWHRTQHCVDTNASTLCGELDSFADFNPSAVLDPAVGAALVNTAGPSDGQLAAGTQYVFYEWRRLLNSGNCGEDPCVTVTPTVLDMIIQVTGGSGGSKGGFVFPDDGSYYQFTVY